MEVLINEPAATRRRVYFDLRTIASNGILAASSEAGQTPEISIDGGAWLSLQAPGVPYIGPLVAISPASNGEYYADLTLAAIGAAGTTINTRYKSGNTVETRGRDDPIRVVNYNPWDIPSAVNTVLTALHGAGDWSGQNKLTGTAPGDDPIPINADIARRVATTVSLPFAVDNLDAENWTVIEFVIKRDLDADSDDESLVLVRVFQSGGTNGLIRLGGAPADDATDASITVNSATDALLDLTVDLKAEGYAITPSPEGDDYDYELVMWTGAKKQTIAAGSWAAVRGVRRTPTPPAT